MKCKNIVVFKGVDERAGGEFTNERGQVIKYDKSYVVRFDEEVNGEVSEKRAKFKGTMDTLYNKFKTLKTYDKIELLFEVNILNNGCKIEIIDFSSLK